MSLIVTAIIAFFVVDGAWRWVVIAGGLLWEAAEIALFLKWSKVRSRMGHETLVGETGKAVTDCMPDGQVQVRGQIWTATCEPGVTSGSEVKVASTDGLLLRVTPYDRYAGTTWDAGSG